MKKPRCYFIKLFAVLLAVMLLTACTQSEGRDSEDSDRETVPLIGLSFDSFIIERWQRDRDAFVSTAQDLGAEVNVQNANGDIDEQIKQLEYFIQKKVDAIVVIAIDGYALTDVIQRAKAAGIWVIAYDRLIMDADVDLYISFDNERMGEMMAESLIKSLPAGSNIISICGSQTDNNVIQAQEGFERVISQSDINVLSTEYAKNWLAEVAYHAVNKAIADGLSFEGVRCGNDDLAGQAFLALSEHRLAGKVALVGQDADLAACQRIVEGTQLMTVYKPVEKLAKQAAERTMQMIRGEAVVTQNEINNGRKNVPYDKLEPIRVTKENMDSLIIDGGFHRREQVYLNVN